MEQKDGIRWLDEESWSYNCKIGDLGFRLW